MIVCGTGHRPDKLGGYDAGVRGKLYDVAHNYLAMEHRISEVVSGMALGFDQALARVAIDLGIPVVAAIPFQGQERKWPADAQAYYRKLLERCKFAKLVCEGDYAPQKMQARNEWMVDYSHRVVALWNGDPTGGTYNCVQYAKGLCRPIDNLWHDWESL